MLKKFYDKNELWFAIGSIIIYVFVMGNLKANFGTESLYSVIGLLLITGVLLGFVLKNGLSDKYGLKKAPFSKDLLFYVPLVLISSVNLWFGVKLNYDVTHQIFAVITMALSGVVEELIFRGLLFKAIEKDSFKEAVIISSVTFGAGHIINLLTGGATVETFLQMAYAIAIGFAFVLTFIKSRSLIPCIAAHSFINVTAEFAVESSTVASYIQVAFLIVVAVGYALYLSKRSKVVNC